MNKIFRLTFRYFQYPPWHSVKLDSVGNVIESYGLIFALLDEIGGRMNFTYHVVTPSSDDQYFGAPQPSGEKIRVMQKLH